MAMRDTNLDLGVKLCTWLRLRCEPTQDCR
jgi:hypothetical protein